MTMLWQDLHTHTVHSDGTSDIRLMIQTAGVYGLNTIAITDHCSDRYSFDAERLQQECAAARKEAACHVIAGVEAVVLDIDGHLSIADEMIPHLELVLGELNRKTKGCFESGHPEQRAENIIRAMVNACRRNPCLRILAHPLNVAAPAGVDLALFTEDLLDELALACRQNQVAFELMSDQWWWFRNQPLDKVTEEYARIVSYIAGKGVELTLGSDAHSHQGVGNFIWAMRVMELADIDESRIAYIVPPNPTPGVAIAGAKEANSHEH